LLGNDKPTNCFIDLSVTIMPISLVPRMILNEDNGSNTVHSSLKNCSEQRDMRIAVGIWGVLKHSGPPERRKCRSAGKE
jgi:hypothetical protein